MSVQIFDDYVQVTGDTTATVITAGVPGLGVLRVNGSPLPVEPGINLIAGTNVTFVAVDNPGASRTDVTINVGDNDSTYALDNAVVHLAGTETITGLKTFQSASTTPSSFLRVLAPNAALDTSSIGIGIGTAISNQASGFLAWLPSATPANSLLSLETYGGSNPIRIWGSSLSILSNVIAGRGVGQYGRNPPATIPARPVTLADVIAAGTAAGQWA